MLNNNQIFEIRKLYSEGYNESQISRKLGFARSTVSKYLSIDSFQVKPPLPQQRTNTKGAKLETHIKDLVIANLSRSKKDRYTGKVIYEMLKENDFYGVGELTPRSVNRIIKKIKDELMLDKSKIKIESFREPGDAEIDFGEVHMFGQSDGAELALHILVLTFPQSNKRFAWLLPAQNFECLAFGLSRLFKVIGGVPRRIRLDNMSAAVSRVISASKPATPGEKVFVDVNGKERVLTSNFDRLRLHYGFELEFCNPASGNEKGSVENAVGWFRRNYFNHHNIFDGNYESFNSDLLAFANKQAEAKHYKAISNDDTIESRFQKDHTVLKALPNKPFICASWGEATVNTYGRIVIEGNEYTAGGAYPRNKVLVHKFWDTIEICTLKGDVLASFPRSYDVRHTFIDWKVELNSLIDRPVGFRTSNLAKAMPEQCKVYIMSLRPTERPAVFQAMLDRLQHNSISDVVSILKACMNAAAGRGSKLSANSMACEIRGYNESNAFADPSSLKGLPASWAVAPKIEVSDKYEPADDKSSGDM